MGCGGSRKEVKTINLPPERIITEEDFHQNKDKFLEKTLNFQLIMNSDQEVYNIVEKLKKNQRKDDFKNEFDDLFWDMFSAKNNQFNKGEVQNCILDLMADSFILRNFSVQRYDLMEVLLKFIDKFDLNPTETETLKSLFNDKDFNLKNSLGINYDYNQLIINTNVFNFSHINSCLNYGSQYNSLSIIHINLDVTYPIDPLHINGLAELIENKNIEVLSIIFYAKLGEVNSRKELIEFNINQYSLILFRAAKNSKSLKHFSLGFNFKSEMIKNKIELSNLFYYSLIEILKKGQLISFCLVQFNSIKNAIIDLFCLVLKNLKSLRFLYLDIDKLENSNNLFKEVNKINGLTIFVIVSNICADNSEEITKLFEYNSSLKFMKFLKEYSV